MRKEKKQRVDNEYWLTRCPFIVSFLYLYSPVKMVYFFLVFSRLFVVVVSFSTLAGKGFRLCVGGLLNPKTVCQHQSLLIAQMFLFAISAQ